MFAMMLKCLLLLTAGVCAVLANDCVNVYHGECHNVTSQCPSRFQSHALSQGICGPASDQQCCYHVRSNTTSNHTGNTACERTYHGECHSIDVGCPARFHRFTVNFCGFLQQCCYNTFTTATTPSNHSTGSCGVSAVNSQHRIIGGTTALAGEFPWQVSLLERGKSVCGGTLIDPQHVVTAAHCFQGSSSALTTWTVGVGSIDERNLEIHNVIQITVHNNYNRKNFANDIVVLRLDSPVDITGRDVRTVCLPDEGEDFAGHTCTVTGWGSLSEGGDYPRYLHKVDLPILQDNLCVYYLGNDAGYTTKELCAGFAEGGKDSCEGDSGGPLVCQKDGVWKLAGITSWGNGCAERENPGVYTRVSKYISWIEGAKHA